MSILCFKIFFPSNKSFSKWDSSKVIVFNVPFFKSFIFIFNFIRWFLVLVNLICLAKLLLGNAHVKVIVVVFLNLCWWLCIYLSETWELRRFRLLFWLLWFCWRIWGGTFGEGVDWWFEERFALFLFLVLLLDVGFKGCWLNLLNWFGLKCVAFKGCWFSLVGWFGFELKCIGLGLFFGLYWFGLFR